MARYITLGDEFINLDKVCNIQIYTRTTAYDDNIVIAEVEFDHSIRKIACAGNEEEVQTQITEAIRCAVEGFCPGPARAI